MQREDSRAENVSSGRQLSVWTGPHLRAVLAELCRRRACVRQPVQPAGSLPSANPDLRHGKVVWCVEMGTSSPGDPVTSCCNAKCL